MKCPVCADTNLVMSERQGIEIDYCPQCRGVWLDRGELDKLIERTIAAMPAGVPQRETSAAPPPAQPGHYPEQRRAYSDEHDYRHKNSDEHDYRHKKKRGFLGDLFDSDWVLTPGIKPTLLIHDGISWLLSLRYCFSYSGIKTFDNRGTAIREMTRVAKAGVKIVIVDEMIKLMEALTWFLDIRQLLGTYLDLEP